MLALKPTISNRWWPQQKVELHLILFWTILQFSFSFMNKSIIKFNYNNKFINSRHNTPVQTKQFYILSVSPQKKSREHTPSGWLILTKTIPSARCQINIGQTKIRIAHLHCDSSTQPSPDWNPAHLYWPHIDAIKHGVTSKFPVNSHKQHTTYQRLSSFQGTR